MGYHRLVEEDAGFTNWGIISITLVKVEKQKKKSRGT